MKIIIECSICESSIEYIKKPDVVKLSGIYKQQNSRKVETRIWWVIRSSRREYYYKEIPVTCKSLLCPVCSEYSWLTGWQDDKGNIYDGLGKWEIHNIVVK
jgi:hypothetical protein